MSRIMSAIEGISDEHIKEFAFVKIPQRTIPVWVKVGSLAASFVLFALAITLVVGKRSQLSPVIGSESESEYTSSGHSYPQTENSENSSINDSSGSSDSQTTTVMPKVILNDITSILAPHDYPTYDLPEGYVFVGQVTSNDKVDENANGYSWGCHVGDKIYQNPTDPQDVFVSTTFLADSDENWYVKFVNSDYFRRFL